MFNEKLKTTSIRDLEKANQEYMVVFKKVIKDIELLHQSRTRAIRSIMKIERYITSLANKPRGYETRIGQINIRYTEFNNRIEEIKALEEKDRSINYGRYMGTGVMVGVGGAALAPSAAMAIAMTFGTASTGTAIASLSGIAATNAALAWLGGGALVAGGAGVAGGEALLAMAGPIGWVIGGASLVGGALLKTKNNTDIAKKAENATKAILKEKERMREVSVQVRAWRSETTKLSVELEKKITALRLKKDYMAFSDDEKKELAILMNMTEVLSKKLEDKVS